MGLERRKTTERLWERVAALMNLDPLCPEKSAARWLSVRYPLFESYSCFLPYDCNMTVRTRRRFTFDSEKQPKSSYFNVVCVAL